MKKILTILALLLALNANATNWLNYYIYHETEYIQGPWSRIDILEKSDYKYLAAQAYEDLLGSERIDLVKKILLHLKEQKPKVYTWDYELSLHGDTIILSTEELIEHIGTIKNELTASLTLNGFEAVVFQIGNKKETMTIFDLTLPYFDLVVTHENSNLILEQKKTKEVSPESRSDNQENPFTIWLIVLGLIIIGLLGFIIIRK